MIKVCAKLKVFTVQLTDSYDIYQFSNSLEHALKYSGHINLGLFHVLCNWPCLSFGKTNNNFFQFKNLGKSSVMILIEESIVKYFIYSNVYIIII